MTIVYNLMFKIQIKKANIYVYTYIYLIYQFMHKIFFKRDKSKNIRLKH